MDDKIIKLAQEMQSRTVQRRRDFHRYAESAWTEFRTAAKVADTLTALGYNVLVGDEVIAAEAMMGVPPVADLERHMERALIQGANPKWLEKMRGGKTGVVGVLQFSKPGPTIALRFDMDANDAQEAEDVVHRPFNEGFSSLNRGIMHACGHDGHTAVGLGVAEILAQLKDELAGRVKIIFQPAEEGVRGAKAMMVKGVADDVDAIIGMHLGMSLRETGEVACMTEGFLATTKLDAEFTGVPAHAAAAPEAGRNALLAAATAAINLHAIPRHSMGESRINVGVLQAGSGRNVIPANAVIKIETRGTTSTINEYVCAEAVRIIEAAAAMHGVKVAINKVGASVGCNNDPELGARIKQIAERTGLFFNVKAVGNIRGSEDCTYLMERVQRCGGLASYILIGTEKAAGHHNFHFDFNEDALLLATTLLACTTADLLTNPVKR